VGQKTRKPPPSRASSERGDGGGLGRRKPSVSQFERGVVGQRTRKPLPSRASSEGGEWWWVGRKKLPSVSRFERGRRWLEGRNSLHLAFRARERDGGGLGRKKPPPSRVSSEGGDGWWLETSFQPNKEGNTLLVASKHVVCR